MSRFFISATGSACRPRWSRRRRRRRLRSRSRRSRSRSTAPAVFRNRTGVYPFVLTGAEAPWRKLYDPLGAALARHGLASIVHDEFTPHITLLRDAARLKPAAVAPIAFTVREIVLVHSLLGKTTHIHLARWSLQLAAGPLQAL